MPRALPAVPRVPLLALGMLSLVGGVLGGLLRLAWPMPQIATASAGWHGALMIGAFLGTVVSLERAVAVSRPWAYLAPAAAGIAGLALLAGAAVPIAQSLLVVAATILIFASIQVLQRLLAPFTVVLFVAALCWLVGNLIWLMSDRLVAAVPWWLAFLVLTIAGERLELTRYLPTPPLAQKAFHAIVAVVLLGAGISFWQDTGLRVFGAGLLALAVWLAQFDIARRNVREKNLVRFVAVCLLLGYVWLALGGLIGIAGGFEPGHPWRDAGLHALGLGFVFSMIFGHAPIIFPAVARVKIPYHPVFYLPLLLLHLSLLVRIAGGLSGEFAWRHGGGLANAAALLIFIAVMAASVVRGRGAIPGSAR